MGLKSCCCTTIYILLTLLVLYYARTMQAIASLTPFLSEQQLAEMWWWTQFLFLTDLDTAPRPVHISKLRHLHSQPLEVIEYWVHNDSEAANKFLENSGKPENDNKIYILRGVWANNTKTKLKNMKTVEDVAQHFDMDRVYTPQIARKDVNPNFETKSMSEVMENLSQKESIWSITFDLKFFETQDNFREEYLSLFRELDERLAHRVVDDSLTSHTFLYHGNEMVSHLHAAPLPNYFLQLANSKKWRFIHKRYFPYIGVEKTNSAPLTTPIYYSEGYPEPGLPYTEFTVHAGDLVWFGTWHMHQVRNVHDQVGLAIGQRTKARGWMFKEVFQPMMVYNLLQVPAFFKRMTQFKSDGDSYREADNQLRNDCKSELNKRYSRAWNGTHFLRYDIRKTKDGECEFVIRQLDYQRREILHEFTADDWRPMTS